MINNKIDALVEKSEVDQRVRERLRALFREFSDVISVDRFDLGRTHTLTHSVQMRDQMPVFTKQFPIPVEHQEEINRSLEHWLKAEVIEPAHSKYNSPIFLVRKKGQEVAWRTVLDLRRVNQHSIPER